MKWPFLQEQLKHSDVSFIFRLQVSSACCFSVSFYCFSHLLCPTITAVSDDFLLRVSSGLRKKFIPSEPQTSIKVLDSCCKIVI